MNKTIRFYAALAGITAGLAALSVAAYASTGGLDTPANDTSNTLYIAIHGAPVITVVPNSATFTGSISASSSVTAQAFYYNSDARFKNNIHPIDNALDKLLTIKGVEFNWKSDNRPDVGVIAQDVAVQFPQLVHKGNNGMMSVEYANLVGPMIEGMRELRDENTELKAEIKQIHADMAALKQNSGTAHVTKASLTIAQ